MSDINDIPCVPAQLLEEVRAYLDRYYEEPEEAVCTCKEEAGDFLEEAILKDSDAEFFTTADEGVFEEADDEAYEESFSPHYAAFDEAPKRKKPGLFGGRKSAAKESAPVEPRDVFTGSSPDAFKASNANMSMGAASMMNAAMAAPVQSTIGSAAQARKLEDVIGALDKSFMEMVYEFADRKGITDPELQKKAGIDRKAYSKLKCGTSKNPSKSTALAIAIALELNLDDTKDLLSRAGLALSPCSKQDLIVRYFIEKEIYDMYVINYTLDEYGEQPLGAH